MPAIKKGNTLKLQVYEHLREQIIIGHLKPGIRLVEAKLAEELNISRSPIREALNMLEKDGLLQMQDTGGLTVVKPTIQEYQQLYECRLELEPMAAYYAAKRRDVQQLKDIESCLMELEAISESSNMKKLHDLNENFHLAITLASNNHFLAQVVKQFRGVNSFYRKSFLLKKPLHAKDAMKEHQEIYQAICESEADIAKQLMKLHIESDYKLFLQFKSKNLGGENE